MEGALTCDYVIAVAVRCMRRVCVQFATTKHRVPWTDRWFAHSSLPVNRFCFSPVFLLLLRSKSSGQRFVRNRRFQKNRRALLDGIFVHHPMFDACLKDIHLACQQGVLAARMVAVELQATYSKRAFVDRQFRVKQQLRDAVAATVEAAKARVRTLMDEIQDPERVKVCPPGWLAGFVCACVRVCVRVCVLVVVWRLI